MTSESDIAQIRDALTVAEGSGVMHGNLRRRISGALAALERVSKSSLRENVLELHRVYEQPIGVTPRDLTEEQVRRRIALVGEEFVEWLDALGADRVMIFQLHVCVDHMTTMPLRPMRLGDVVDGCEDLKVVVEGTLVEAGVDSGPMTAEVHRSNMSKLGPDGKPIKNALGKFLKGPNYSPPDIATELERQGWGR